MVSICSDFISVADTGTSLASSSLRSAVMMTASSWFLSLLCAIAWLAGQAAMIRPTVNAKCWGRGRMDKMALGLLILQNSWGVCRQPWHGVGSQECSKKRA